MSTKTALLTLAAVLTLAVAYYFAIALPRYNEERLALERQRYADEQKRSADEATLREVREAARAAELDRCLAQADAARISFLKLNGTTHADGTVWTEDRFQERANVERQRAVENCYRRYPAVK